MAQNHLESLRSAGILLPETAEIENHYFEILPNETTVLPPPLSVPYIQPVVCEPACSYGLSDHVKHLCQVRSLSMLGEVCRKSLKWTFVLMLCVILIFVFLFTLFHALLSMSSSQKIVQYNQQETEFAEQAANEFAGEAL